MARQHLDGDGFTLVACCDDAYALQAQSLLEAVASFAGQGKGLADGVTVQLGWSVLTLRQKGSELLVCEPDFDGDPFHEVREDVTCTLAVLTEQAAILNRLGVEPVEVRFDERVLLARGCLAQQRVYLQRSEPQPGDSGWYVGSVDGPAPGQEPDSYESLLVFHLGQRRASLMQVLGLPSGYLAVFDGDEVAGIADPDNNEVWNTEP